MNISIEAFDKYGLSVLGNMYGQTIIKAKQYKRTNIYKAIKAGRLAGDRIEQYKVYRLLGSNIYDPSQELLETIYIQDLSN